MSRDPLLQPFRLKHLTLRNCILLAGLALSSAPAFAGEPADIVRGFYTPLVAVTAPAARHLFIDMALSNLEAHDAMISNGAELGCFDFGLEIDAQDFDQAAIDATLELFETGDDARAEVTAKFLLFPDDKASAREIVWSLVKPAGTWRISDVASPANKWKLSEFDCN